MKKLIIFLMAAVMSVSVLLTGCSQFNVTPPDSTEPTPPSDTLNPFEENSNPLAPASICHGLDSPEFDAEDNRIPLEYNGGEMTVDYTVNSVGKGRNVGFLLFLDGKPQPYRIDGESNYLNTLSIPDEYDNKEYPVAFRFTPVTGNKGDTLYITFVSVYNPDFKPDMVTTEGYGQYHETVPYQWELSMNVSAAADGLPTVKPMLSNLTTDTPKVTKAFLEEEMPAFGYSMITADNQSDSNVFHIMSFDGKRVFSNLDVSAGTHIAYKIYAPAGVVTETTFYIDHTPISSTDGQTSFRFAPNKGDMSVIEFDIDPAQLSDLSTFYAVTVPESKYLDFSILKTDSMLLYKTGSTTTTPETAVTPPSVPTATASPEPSATSAPEMTAPSTNPTATATPTPTQTPEPTTTPLPTTTESPVQTQTGSFDLFAFSGKVKNAYYGKEGSAIIQADYLYRYDPQSGTVTKGPKSDYYRMSVWVTDKGFAIIGRAYGSSSEVGFGSSDTESIVCVLYDSNFNETTRIDMKALLEKDDIFSAGLCAAVSTDGKKLAYVTLSGLFCHDIASGKSTKIVDLKVNNEVNDLRLGMFDKVTFTDSSHIAFTAAAMPLPIVQGKQSDMVYGTISTDGNGLTMKKPSSYTIGEEFNARGSTLYMPDNFYKTKGKLLTVNNGTEKIISFSSTAEGKSGVYISDKGGYIATAVLSSEMTIRIYDSKGTLIKTETLKDVGKDQLKVKPVVLILEDSKTCIVLPGALQAPSIDTQAFTFGY